MSLKTDVLETIEKHRTAKPHPHGRRKGVRSRTGYEMKAPKGFADDWQKTVQNAREATRGNAARSKLRSLLGKQVADILSR